MILRTWRRKEKPNWRERSGGFNIPPPKEAKPRIWFHAVSVGEVVAARPILRELRKALPGHEILLSVTTSSGYRTAREGESGLFDHLVYFPIDIPRFQLSAMQQVRPDAVVIMETELWKNFLWAAKVFDARTILVNGRISDRSFPRARAFSFFYRALMKDLDRALMQTELDAERIKILGARSAEVFGNAKFDQGLESVEADPAEWCEQLGIPEGNRVVVIGSTRGEQEEELVLDALSRVDLSRVSVVHAPRHLESVPALVDRVRRRFGSVVRRSEIGGSTVASYVVLDTYGELAKIYGIADVVVVGGGFANLGGQNIVQPLAAGKPVLHGPHMQNFREPAAMADAAGAALVCRTAAELGAALNELLQDPARRARMGEAARALVRSQVGASARYATAIAEEVAAGQATKAPKAPRERK